MVSPGQHFQGGGLAQRGEFQAESVFPQRLLVVVVLRPETHGFLQTRLLHPLAIIGDHEGLKTIRFREEAQHDALRFRADRVIDNVRYGLLKGVSEKT